MIAFAAAHVSFSSSSSAFNRKASTFSLISYDEHCGRLARQAFEAAQNRNARMMREDDDWQQAAVIRTVGLALERAFSDPEFAALSQSEQEDAAIMLACQCQQAMQIAGALHGALMNPATLVHQLRSNALNPYWKHDVFEQIIRAHRPATTVQGDHAMPVQYAEA